LFFFPSPFPPFGLREGDSFPFPPFVRHERQFPNTLGAAPSIPFLVFPNFFFFFFFLFLSGTASVLRFRRWYLPLFPVSGGSFLVVAEVLPPPFWPRRIFSRAGRWSHKKNWTLLCELLFEFDAERSSLLTGEHLFFFPQNPRWAPPDSRKRETVLPFFPSERMIGKPHFFQGGPSWAGFKMRGRAREETVPPPPLCSPNRQNVQSTRTPTWCRIGFSSPLLPQGAGGF